MRSGEAPGSPPGVKEPDLPPGGGEAAGEGADSPPGAAPARAAAEEGEGRVAPPEPGFRSGFAAILGRPNVGKSTLLNALLGQKVAIVSPKPNTTRFRVLGVREVPGAQAVFVDTPGLQAGDSLLGRFLVEQIKDAAVGADLILFMTDPWGEEKDREVMAFVREVRVPVFLLLNKIDRVPKERVLELLARYPEVYPFEEYFPLSALRGANVPELLRSVVAHLPEGPRYFPEGTLTDMPEPRVAAELIREQVFLQTHQEVPYASAVVVETYERLPNGVFHVEAAVYVERDSQRGILIGKGGRQVKALGMAARLEMERRLGSKVFLELTIRVKPDWRQREGTLKELGFE